MEIFAPNPRYRIYAKAWYYFSFFVDLFMNRLHKGNAVEILEKRMSERFQVPFAIITPMARVGIYLSIKNVIRPGQKVIMSPYTIADVVNMVIAAKGIPVFADIQSKTCNIDPKEVEKLIDSSVGAVLITHLHGLTCPLDEIRKLCIRFRVLLIEDCSQAFGTRYGGRAVGTTGTVGIYSLGMYKNINCWYGGLILTHDSVIAEKIRAEINSWPFQGTFFIFLRMLKALRADLMTIPALFKTFTFWIFRFGFINGIEPINKLVRTELDTSRRDFIPEKFKGRLTPYQARLVLAQLGHINGQSRIRISFGEIYQKELSKLPELLVPPACSDFEHIYTYFPIQFEQRDLLIEWMMKHNCDVAAQHFENCADLPGF
ncbi:MAG: DegT/DnrJ/EryC1/StrS family aminotransferase [Bdellovibrionales bacterium]|nr:DegT/DnrJ/EryC1/StrS family aminotransferase [Bdellovibrionales bacterium]